MELIYGILGLGLVVIIHEAGHFFAARAVGIHVEVFSVGWGKKLIGFHRGGTEYRISWIPLGGFIKMKGEVAYQQAVEQGLDRIEAEKDSFFGAAPWKRIIVSLAGPVMNLIFALLVLTIINLAGYQVGSTDNKVVLADDYPQYIQLPQSPSPAAKAGIQTGDRITAIDGVQTENFLEISTELSSKALDTIDLDVQRGQQELSLQAQLLLNPDSGAGFLGIYEYIEPVVGSLLEDAQSDLQPGDRILSINGTEVHQHFDIRRILDGLNVEAEAQSVRLAVLRDGERIELEHPLVFDGENERFLLGFYYGQRSYTVVSDGLFDALGDSWGEIWSTLSMTVKGIGLMFQGLNPMKALSGPIKITMIVGEVTAQGLSQGLAVGLRAFFHLLSLLSVALFFGNLLPIPVLDGGQIVITLVEMIKGSPIHPKAFFRYQAVGAVIIFILIAVILFGDLRFAFTR